MKAKNSKANLDIIRDYLDGTRPYIQVGYTGYVHRNEGETWVDHNGVEWQRKNGKNFKLTKTQGDIIREAMGVQKCKCGLEIRWGNKYDQKFFVRTGMCYNCLIEYETKLKILGIFELYEKCKLLSNEVAFFKDVRSKLQDIQTFFEKEDTSIEILCNSEGFREKFTGTNRDQIIEDVTRDLKMVRKYLREITQKLKENKKEFNKKASEYKVKKYV